MTSSLEALTGYVPPNVLRRLPGGLAELPYADEFEGAVLIADISGFTAITEQMARRGPEGAETLAELLNVYFGRLIDHVDERGGDVFSFTGDGLIAAWSRAEGEGLDGALHAATACALALAATESEDPEVAGVRLSVRLGVGAGRLRALELGGLHGRRFSLLGGEPLEDAAVASEIVGAGQVGVGAARWPMLAPRARGEAVGTAYVRIDELEAAPAPPAGATRDPPAPPAAATRDPPAPPAAATRDPVPAALLIPYIPPPVLSREGIGQGDWLAELRRVTVVYVRLPGIDHRAEPRLVQEAVLALQGEFDRHEATINNLSVDAKGTSMIAATGLPPLSHDDDPVRAVRAAMAVARTLGQEHGVVAGVGRRDRARRRCSATRRSRWPAPRPGPPATTPGRPSSSPRPRPPPRRSASPITSRSATSSRGARSSTPASSRRHGRCSRRAGRRTSAGGRGPRSPTSTPRLLPSWTNGIPICKPAYRGRLGIISAPGS